MRLGIGKERSKKILNQKDGIAISWDGEGYGWSLFRENICNSILEPLGLLSMVVRLRVGVFCRQLVTQVWVSEGSSGLDIEVCQLSAYWCHKLWNDTVKEGWNFREIPTKIRDKNVCPLNIIRKILEEDLKDNKAIIIG